MICFPLSFVTERLDSDRVDSGADSGTDWIRRTACPWNSRMLLALGVILGSLFSGGPITVAQETSVPSEATSNSQTSSESESEEIIVPAEPFVPDFDDQDLAGTQERAWEFRPYRVAVWFCLDGSPGLNSTYEKIAMDVTRRSELLDPSGWDLETGRAPAKWRNLFLKFIETPEKCIGFSEFESLDAYDKIMIVCMQNEFGLTRIRVREFDIRTQQWGPMLVREVSQKNQIGQTVMDAISVAFMPLARIDRITEVIERDAQGERRSRDEVYMQVRSIRSCLRTELNDFLEWTVQPIEDSPVFIRPDDRFLPVIRVNDRKGDLLRLEPIEFTYLTINELDSTSVTVSVGEAAEDGESSDDAPGEDSSEDSSEDSETSEDSEANETAEANTDNEAPEDPDAATEIANPSNIAVLRCSIQSNRRSPLNQRKSKHAQKLALVIRPPQRPTTLFLYSSDKEKTPMEGFEIYSRRPAAVPGEANEFLGKTDWEGSIVIPPSPDGLRIIMVSRGARRFLRLPIMPGLYDSVETTLANDETRLFAEGVIKGLNNEILSLVIRREVFEGDIEAALEKNDLEDARARFNEYRDLETLADLKAKLSDNLVQLKLRTGDDGELDYIDNMFNALREVLDKKIKLSKESGLQEEIQKRVTASRKEQE